MNRVYIGTLNGRYILTSRSIAGIKSQASRIANRAYRPIDFIRITSREADGSLSVWLLGRMSSKEDDVITRSPWTMQKAV